MVNIGLNLKINNICNTACIFCSSAYNSSNVVDITNIANIVNHYLDLKVGNYINVTGGEVTLSPHILEILTSIENVKIHISTNGLSIDKLTDELCNKISLINYSLLDINKTNYDQMRGDDSYDICLKNLFDLKKRTKSIIQLSTIISKITQNSLIDYAKFANDNGFHLSIGPLLNKFGLPFNKISDDLKELYDINYSILDRQLDYISNHFPQFLTPQYSIEVLKFLKEIVNSNYELPNEREYPICELRMIEIFPQFCLPPCIKNDVATVNYDSCSLRYGYRCITGGRSSTTGILELSADVKRCTRQCGICTCTNRLNTRLSL